MIKDPEDTSPYRTTRMNAFIPLALALLMFLILVLLANCAGTIGAFQSTVTITSDRGGNISSYISKYKSWAAANKRIIVNGYCASSCTLFIAIVPPVNVCVTPNAKFGFHGAWDPTFFGQVEDPAATLVMMSEYTQPIKDWIASKGGLTSYKIMLVMGWPETATYFAVCT